MFLGTSTEAMLRLHPCCHGWWSRENFLIWANPLARSHASRRLVDPYASWKSSAGTSVFRDACETMHVCTVNKVSRWRLHPQALHPQLTLAVFVGIREASSQQFLAFGVTAPNRARVNQDSHQTLPHELRRAHEPRCSLSNQSTARSNGIGCGGSVVHASGI